MLNSIKFMEQTRETFENFITQKNKIPNKKLDDFFASLEPVKMEEMSGEWTGKCFYAGNRTEFFLKDFVLFKWRGKKFINPNNVKALIFSFLGIKFNIPGCTAVIRELKFRNKISTSMIYDYLPIIDNFRKIDDDTVMGIAEIKGKIGAYFYLNRNLPENH